MTFLELLSGATWAVPFILIVGIAIGMQRRKYLQREYRLLINYLIICLLTDICSRVAGELYGNNLIFIVLFSILELVFFFQYLYPSFSKKAAKYYGIAVLCGVIYMTYELFSLRNVAPAAFQPYSKVLGAFLIIIMVLNYIFDKMKQELTASPFYALYSVFILYFSLNLIFFLPINFLINVSSSVKFYFWCANFLLTLSFYTYLSHKIWKNGTTKKQLRPGS